MIELHWFQFVGVLSLLVVAGTGAFKIFQGRAFEFLEDRCTYETLFAKRQGDFMFMVLMKTDSSYKTYRLYKLATSQLKKEGGEGLVEVPDRFRIFMGSEVIINNIDQRRQKAEIHTTYHFHEVGPND